MALMHKLLLVLWLAVACCTTTTAITAPVTTAGTAATPAPVTTAGTEATPAPVTTAGTEATPAPVTTAGTAATPAPVTTAGTEATPAPVTTAGTAATPAPVTTAGTAATPAPVTTAGTAATPAPVTTAGTAATPAPETTAGTEATPAPETTAGTEATPTPGTTAATPTTASPDPCASNPCGNEADCEPRAGKTFICLCLVGEYFNYDMKSCQTAKAFPGELNLPKLTYRDGMDDVKSQVFNDTSRDITDDLEKAFDGLGGYIYSTVLDIQKVSKTLRSQHARANVEIFFTLESEVTTEKVEGQIKDCVGCLFQGESFGGTKLCDMDACDEITTTCESADGTLTCTCKEGYNKSNLTNRVCVACPSGQKAIDGSCAPCGFGLSGLNCNERWELVLVIVGSVFGGLLLITLIVLGVMVRKPSKKSSKKNGDADIGKPYVSNFSAKAPLGDDGPANGRSAFGGAGVPRIPRATAASSWERSSNLEMAPSNSRQNLIPAGRSQQLYDDPNDMNGHPFGQNRAQNNPYAQNRAQVNPYAQSRGQANPYYMHDDGRRLN